MAVGIEVADPKGGRSVGEEEGRGVKGADGVGEAGVVVSQKVLHDVLVRVCIDVVGTDNRTVTALRCLVDLVGAGKGNRVGRVGHPLLLKVHVALCRQENDIADIVAVNVAVERSTAPDGTIGRPVTLDGNALPVVGMVGARKVNGRAGRDVPDHDIVDPVLVEIENGHSRL